MEFIDTDFIIKLAKEINILAYIECEGCNNGYASFKHHTCYSNPWFVKVFEFCRRALENLSRQKETKEEANKYLQSTNLHIQLRRYLEEYGSSFLDL